MSPRRLLRRMGLWAAGLYLAMLAAMFFGQRLILYVPHDIEIAPRAEGLAGVTARRMAVSGGDEVIIWQAPPTKRRETILYLHGNGGTLAYRSRRYGLFLNEGYGLAVLSYRGYGGSTGRPTEASNVEDAVALYDRLRQDGVPTERIIVFGESLGSGVAVQLAARRQVAALLLDSPFSSIEDVAAARFWWLPVRGMVWETYNSFAHIGRARAPLLVLQGDRDHVVPPGTGRKLFEAAHSPKELIVLPGERHTPPLALAWARIERFLAAHLSP